MAKKRRLKTKVKNFFKGLSMFLSITTLIIIIITLLILIFRDIYNKNKIDIVKIYQGNNDDVIIELDTDGYCSIDNETWIDSGDKKCVLRNTFFIDKVYIKKEADSTVIEKDLSVDYSYVEELKVNKTKMVLAVDDHDRINYGVIIKGRVNQEVSFSSDDESIASVDQEGLVTGVSDGDTKIRVKIADKEYVVDVRVSSLINPIAAEFDFDKEYLTCDMYSKEENDILDEILEFRVNEAGYQTRAGAVAVARFIGLEFPYIINYFSENGRYPGVDGEGRYYHKGLYLDESRFDILTGSSHGPAPWGCYIFSDPAEKEIRNGFDCSGFISWVLKNAGYAPGDIGAGISEGIDDLTDLGNKEKLTVDVIENSLKVGDLLSGDGDPTIVAINGGHIAMVVGITDDSVFVAEELWWGTGYVGAVIRKYSYKELVDYFYWQIEMDEFYGEDGNLTNYWID